ncbi:MAG: FmdB family zinc ribbon protein [Endomicrobiia bacterium]
MITYQFDCPQCGYLEIIASIKDTVSENCPHCNSKMQRIFGTPYVFIRGEPNNVMSISDYNVRKNGSYYKDKMEEKKEKRELARKMAAEAVGAKLLKREN